MASSLNLVGVGCSETCTPTLDPARQQTLAETRMADVGDLVKEWNA